MKTAVKLIVLLWFGLLIACNQNGYERDYSEHLARVGSETLTLQEALNHIPVFVLKQDSLDALSRYRQQWIQRQLLLKKAENLQLADQNSIQQRLQNARQEVLINALRDVIWQKNKSTQKISDREVLQYFNNIKEQFVLKERYIRYRHISTRSFSYARAARRELESGTPWPEVARRYSTLPEQRIQHSQKYWPQSTVLEGYPDLKENIVSLDSLEISPYQRNDGNYHFVQLMDVREAGEYPKPEWIMKRLKEWILLEKQQQFFNSYLKNLYLEARQNNEIELYNVLPTNGTMLPDSVQTK